MRGCIQCGSDVLVPESVGLCARCLARCGCAEVRARTRKSFGLPPAPPKHGALQCTQCRNECRIGEGESGFCGLRKNEGGRLETIAGTASRGLCEWYYDPLPTNCVAAWVCPAGTGVGYPRYAVKAGPEKGYKNLAVFYEACSFDCLFCQNWHFRRVRPERSRKTSAKDLAAKVDDMTTCICFFGGDPSCQMPHALAAAKMAVQARGQGVLRVCWETNGYMTRSALEQALELSLVTGGCIKFDLKCWDEALHVALTGVSNGPVLENFAFAATFISQRPEVPLVVASTLLVPGYVDCSEVEHIAKFIASLDPNIPYSLLAFHPDFLLYDLPRTSRREALEALSRAQVAGLKRVHIGNMHLLW